jgi:hypothetical protein
MATNPVEPQIPIGGCGHSGEPACPPIICIVGADGKTYIIHGAERVIVQDPTPAGPAQE